MTTAEGRLGTEPHQDLAQFIWKLNKTAKALAAFHLRSLFSEETVPWSLNSCTGLGTSGTGRRSARRSETRPRGAAAAHVVSGANTRAPRRELARWCVCPCGGSAHCWPRRTGLTEAFHLFIFCSPCAQMYRDGAGLAETVLSD